MELLRVENETRQSSLLQRFVDFNVSAKDIGQKVREIDAFLLGSYREILPHATFYGSWKEDLGARQDVMQTANALAEVDLSWHAVILDWLIAHWFSSYWRVSVGVARRAEISRTFVIGGSDSDERHATESILPLVSKADRNPLALRYQQFSPTQDSLRRLTLRAALFKARLMLAHDRVSDQTRRVLFLRRDSQEGLRDRGGASSRSRLGFWRFVSLG